MSTSYDTIEFLTETEYVQSVGSVQVYGASFFFISTDQIPDNAEVHFFGQYVNDAIVTEPSILRAHFLRYQDLNVGFDYGLTLVEGVVTSGSGYFSFHAPLPPLTSGSGFLFFTRQNLASIGAAGMSHPGIRFTTPANPLVPSVSSGSVALTFQTWGTASIGPFAPSENSNDTFTPGIDWDGVPAGTHFRVKWTLDVDDLAGGNLELSLYSQSDQFPYVEVFFDKAVLSSTGKQTVELGPFPRQHGYQRMITKYRSTTALSGSVVAGTPIVEVFSFDA